MDDIKTETSPILPEPAMEDRIQTTVTEREKIQKVLDQTFIYTFKLLKYFLSEKENFIVSPFSSIASLLGLIVGSSGETRVEIMNAALGIELSDEDEEKMLELIRELLISITQHSRDVTLKCPSYIFSCNDYKLNSELMSKFYKFLGITYRKINLSEKEGIQMVTELVKKDTSDNVNGLLSEVGKEVNMLLMDCLYFRGIWKYSLKEEQTALFHDSDGNSYDIPFLKGVGVYKLGFNETFRFHVLEIPYLNPIFKLMIFLPENDTTSLTKTMNDFLVDNEDNICNELVKVMDSTNLTEATIEILLPKFKLECDTYFKEILQKTFGISRIFDKDSVDLMKMQEPIEEESSLMQRVKMNEEPFNMKTKSESDDIDDQELENSEMMKKLRKIKEQTDFNNKVIAGAEARTKQAAATAIEELKFKLLERIKENTMEKEEPLISAGEVITTEDEIKGMKEIRKALEKGAEAEMDDEESTKSSLQLVNTARERSPRVDEKEVEEELKAEVEKTEPQESQNSFIDEVIKEKDEEEEFKNFKIEKESKKEASTEEDKMDDEDEIGFKKVTTVDYELKNDENVRVVKVLAGLALEEIVQKCIFETRGEGHEKLTIRDTIDVMSKGVLEPFRCSRPFLFALIVKVEGKRYFLQIGAFKKPQSSGYTYE